MVLVALQLTGCADEPVRGIPQAADEQARVLQALSAAHDSLLNQAFAQGLPYAYTRISRTEVRSRSQSAATERIVRIEGPGQAALLIADTTGSFEGGLFGRRQEIILSTENLESLRQHVLSTDPPYFDERYHEEFVYRFAADTLLMGRATRVVQVLAHPSLGTSQPLRHVRYHIDRRTGGITGLYVERTVSRLFIRESSRFYLSLRLGPDARWVPFQYRFHSRLKLPLHAERTVRTSRTYYNWSPLRKTDAQLDPAPSTSG